MADVIKFYGLPRVKVSGTEWGVLNRKDIASVKVYERISNDYYYYATTTTGEVYQIYVGITKTGLNCGKLIMDEFATCKEKISKDLMDSQAASKKLVATIECTPTMERSTYERIIEHRLMERR